jgi:hypothetical protein
MNKYRGITYFHFLSNRFCHWLFKKYFCGKNIHLFDESESLEWHMLSCDACGLEVHIKKIVEEKDSDIDDMEVRNDKPA